MKFPLRERPFHGLSLSPEQLERLATVADEVGQANLDEFHDFVHVHNRTLPSNRYKPVKRHDRVTIYKEIKPREERISGPLAKPRRDGPPLLPKLVATGTVRGCMDDMMLGTAVRDAMAVVIKTSYVDDEIVDCAVHEIDGATQEDPFHYLVLKWVAKSHPTGLNAVVAPRDMLVIQSSGFIASQGIGYHLLHSVDDIVPQVGSYEEKFGVLRAKISIMFMFRQLNPETIEVYTVNYVEPNGSAPEAVTIMSTAASMGAVWKSLDCAYNMKLSWILKNKEAYTSQFSRNADDDKCKVCNRKTKLASSMGDCSICDARACNRCRTTKKLSKANRRLELIIEKHDFCKTCLYRAVNDDAFRIASEMNVGIPITPWREGDELKVRKFSQVDSRDSRSSNDTNTSFGSYTTRSRLNKSIDARASAVSLPDHERPSDIGGRASTLEFEVEESPTSSPGPETEASEYDLASLPTAASITLPTKTPYYSNSLARKESLSYVIRLTQYSWPFKADAMLA